MVQIQILLFCRVLLFSKVCRLKYYYIKKMDKEITAYNKICSGKTIYANYAHRRIKNKCQNKTTNLNIYKK